MIIWSAFGVGILKADLHSTAFAYNCCMQLAYDIFRANLHGTTKHTVVAGKL